MKIDWKNPITTGLVAVFNGATPTVDIVTGTPSTTFKTSTFGGYSTLVGPSGENSSSVIEFDNALVPGEQFNTDATVLSIYRPHNRFTISNIGLTFFTGANVNYPMLRLGWNDNGNENAQFRVSTDEGLARTLIDSPTGSVPNGKLATTVGVCRGNGINSLTAEIWNNGVLLTGPTNLVRQDQAITGASLNNHYCVLGDNHLNDRGAAVDLFLSCCWNRSLTNAEIENLSSNPWQIFKSQLLFAHEHKYDPTATIEAPLEGETLTITLVDAAGTTLPNLTGLSWAWFDQDTPDTVVAPVNQGTGETTDGSGIFSVQLTNTTLTSGQTGALALMDSTGYIYAWYRITL